MATIAKSSITLVSISDAYSVSLQPSNITINADPYGNNPKLENAFTIISLYCGDIQVPISSASIVGSSLWEEGSNIHKQDCSLEIVGNSVKLSITSIGNQLSGWREIEVITNAGQKLTARFSYTVVRETTMLDWILEWDKNLTEISGDHVATPNAFIGNKDGDGKLTGVYIGGGENHPYLPGIYGFKGCTPEAFAQGNLGSTEIFHLNENGGMIGGWDISNTGLIKENSVGRLEILSEGTIRYVNLLDATNPFWELKSDGSGSFASGHITWDVGGNATFDGKLKAQSGEIGGWAIGSHSLYNTSILLDSANSFFGLRGPSGLMFINEPLSSSFYDSITRAGGIAIYYTDSTHYGLEGWLQGSPTTIDYNKGTQIFGLGSKNFIASWNIGANALWRGDLVNTAGNFTGKSGDITIGSQGIRGYRWYIDADGEADFMQGRVHLGPSKCEIAGWALTETMLKASNVALASGNNCSGLYLSHATLPTTGAASYAEYIRANGGIYLANLPSGPSLRGQNNDGKMTFQLTNGVCFIGGWWFSEECLFTGAKSTPTGEFATEGNITLSPDGLRGFKFRLEADGSGAIAGGNIWWEADGKVHFTDQVSLSWSNVTGKPNLTKIDANGIYTGTISADKITVGSISTDWIKNGIKWGLLIDGSGYLASKNIEWDKDGNINVKGHIEADSGSIGSGDNKFTINSSGISYGDVSSFLKSDNSKKLLLNPELLRIQHSNPDDANQICKIFLGKGAWSRNAEMSPYSTVAWIYKRDLRNLEMEGSRCCEPAVRIETSSYYGAGVAISAEGGVISSGVISEKGYLLTASTSMISMMHFSPFCGSTFIIKNTTGAVCPVQLPSEGMVRFVLDLGVSDPFIYRIKAFCLPGNNNVTVALENNSLTKCYINGREQADATQYNMVANHLYEFTLIYDGNHHAIWHIKDIT